MNKRYLNWKKLLYKHRHGIMGTIIFHLLLGITLLSAEISHMETRRELEIEWDKPEPEVVQQKQQEELKKQELRRQTADEEVEKMLRTIAVNENARAKTSQPHPSQDVQKYIQEIQEELDGSYGNRYKARKDKHHQADSLQHAKDEQQRKLDSLQSTVYAGKSSVSYKIGNRYKIFLPIPIFKCEHGGKIVVKVIVNPKGKVIKAEVVDASSKADESLREVAVDAALRSSFNQDDKAPERQSGTITYHFVKQ